jgi:Ca-activated chloride channel family protein
MREPSLEQGRTEDLTGIVKVYIGPSTPGAAIIIKTVRKRLPQINFVSSREEADVLLLFSEESGTETDANPGPSMDARSSVRIVPILRSQGKVIRLAGPNPAKLVKKFSAKGRIGDGNRLAEDFAEEFIKLYSKVNTGKRSDTKQAAALEPPLERGEIEDLKGGTTVYVDAPDHYSSLFLRNIVDDIRKQIPGLVVVWSKDADIWLLFSADGNVRDASVHGSIIRHFGPGQQRLVKQYSGKGSKGADGFVNEFVRSYQKANPTPPAATARTRQTTELHPSLKKEDGPVNVAAGVTPAVSNINNRGEVTNGDVLRIDTSLVTIHANVISRDGKPAPAIGQADFSVYEDDVKQDIAFFETVDRPFTVILLIDSSISVEGQLTEIVKAARVLVESLRPDDQLAIVTFDAMVKEELKLTKIRELQNEWIKISPQGGTRVYDAVDFAASQYFPRLPGRKAVVLLTDGVDLGSFMTTAKESLHAAEEYDALFYTIQYKTTEAQPRSIEKTQQEYERATAYLRDLAEKTGGRYQRAEGMRDVPLAFASVVKELSAQYSLGYYPKRPPVAGERRRIRVQLTRPDVVIHTRNSYVCKSPAVPK